MLRIPDRHFRKSTTKHNNDLHVICDWIELSTLLSDNQISQTDVIDVLLEEYRYSSQDFASERVGNAWTEIRRRMRMLREHAPLEVDDFTVRARTQWQQVPAYVLCLVLSLAHSYSEWRNQFGSDYTDQGELFEIVTAAALKLLMPGWEIYATGWSRNNTEPLEELASALANRVGEMTHADYEQYVATTTKDGGLDIATYRDFADGRGVRPVYLVQCASGDDWRTKTPFPQLSMWRQIIRFVHPPVKALAIPLSLSDTDFVQAGVLVEGLLIDRCRLLALGLAERDWLPDSASKRIVAWAITRLQWLIDSDANTSLSYDVTTHAVDAG